MEKYQKECKDCKLQKKASNCQQCKEYWVKRYDAAYKSQARANGRIGGQMTRAVAAEGKLAKAETEIQSLEAEYAALQDRYGNLQNGIGKTVATIQICGLFEKRKTLQQAWNMLTDLLVK